MLYDGMITIITYLLTYCLYGATEFEYVGLLLTLMTTTATLLGDQ